MKFLVFLVSVISAISLNDQVCPDQEITNQLLIGQKRDLIGWNRTQNTVNQYARHKTGKDKKTYAKQYKQILMELHQRSLQDLGNELKKAIKMIRKRRKIKNHTR